MVLMNWMLSMCQSHMFSNFVGTICDKVASQTSIPIIIDKANIRSLFLLEIDQMTTEMFDWGDGKPFGANLALITFP